MKIVILGITGFIGKNMLSELNETDEYVCLVRKGRSCEAASSNISMIESSYTRDELTKVFTGADVVIDMIGQMGGAGVTREQFVGTNVGLTREIVEVCRNAGVRQLIFISTPGVQGFGARLRPESDPYAPRDEYEETKVEAEHIVMELTGSDTAWTIIRPDFVYGPEDTRRIRMYRNIRSGRFAITTSGKSYIHPTYVKDVVYGILLCAGNPAAYDDIFNISAKNDITVYDYVSVIAGYFGKRPIKINIGYKMSCFIIELLEKLCSAVHRKSPVTRSQIDFLSIDHSTSIEKAVKKLGYDPQYDFRSGFAATMEWIKANRLM